ncbi:MAG: diacylglycerol kinase [Acidimicrobiales bacterium]|nr:diacylglycerol kinase [Acidimicrobiales bacterium]
MSGRHPQILQRICAVIALVSLVGAVLILFVGSIGNLGPLLLLLVGLIVAVVGAWHLLTRRDVLRFGAVFLVLAGLALLVGGLLRADLNVFRTTAFLFLGLVSVGSARAALGRESRTIGSVQDVSGIDLPQQPVLIMNLKSGGGKAERFHLVDECGKRGIEPIVLTPGDDLVELAEDAVTHGADIIGMAGGDGSQALVAKVAARHNLPFVVVPAGTRNHFALDLGLDRDDVVGALDAFGGGVERKIDLASVNGRIFVNNATLGLYAEIVQSPDYRDAKRQTVAEMLPDLLGSDAPGSDLRFAEPDGTFHSTADVILISNNPYEIHRFAGRGSRARLDEGLLGVAVATINDANEAARFVALELAGQLRRFPGWAEWTVKRIEINADGPVNVGIDGEALSMDPPLVFEALPGALRVRLPLHARGRSPAARAVHLVSRSTIVDLTRAIAGKGPRGF